jgi:hypothetical protein
MIALSVAASPVERFQLRARIALCHLLVAA